MIQAVGEQYRQRLLPRDEKETDFSAHSVAPAAACASAPTGLSVMVLPGSNKSFEQFRFDDYECASTPRIFGGKTAEQRAPMPA